MREKLSIFLIYHTRHELSTEKKCYDVLTIKDNDKIFVTKHLQHNIKMKDRNLGTSLCTIPSDHLMEF
jgi:hypothetical protein